MQEIVLKRTASVTSAEALDQINDAYPDAEILSFRRVREAGNDSEFFVARLRVAEALEDDVVVEGKQHEEEEEEMMREMLSLLKKLVKEEDKEEDPNKDGVFNEKDFQDEEPIDSGLDDLADSHERKPLPQPQQAPYGVVGIGSDIVEKAAALTVERPADVPMAVARVELLREYSGEYKIASINKVGGVYRASLVRLSSEDWGGAEVNDPLIYDVKSKPKAQGPAGYSQDILDAAKQMEENRNDPLVGEQSDTDPFGIPYQVPAPSYIDRNALSDLGYSWLNYLDGQGYGAAVIMSEQNKLMGMTEQEQEQYLQQYVVSSEQRDTARQNQYEDSRSIEQRLTDMRGSILDEFVSLIQNTDAKSLERLQHMKPHKLVEYLQSISPEDRIKLYNLVQGYSSEADTTDVSSPERYPGVSEGFGKKPMSEDDTRGKQRINIPSEKLKEWGSRQMGDNTKVFPLNRKVDIDGARQQIEEQIMSRVINPEDEEEVKEAKDLVESTMERILGPNNRRIRKAEPKRQADWLKRQVRQTLRDLGAEVEDPTKVDLSAPLLETYRDHSKTLEPMQVAKMYRTQKNLEKAKRIRAEKAKRVKDKPAPNVTEQETQRPPTNVYPAKGGQR